MGKKTIAHNTRNTNTKETRNTNLGVNRNKGNNCRHPTTMADVATLTQVSLTSLTDVHRTKGS